LLVCLLAAIAGGAVGLVGLLADRAAAGEALVAGSICEAHELRARQAEDPSLQIEIPPEFASPWPSREACLSHATAEDESTPGPVQPIQFSHKHHAGLFQIDCQYCHSGTDRSAVAGVPSVELCMGCHQQFPPSYDELQGIRTLKEHWELQTPIPWLQINRLPEYVQFQHVAHVRRGILPDLPRAGPGDGQGPSHARYEVVALVASDAEARDGLVRPVSPGERRIAGLRHLPLLRIREPMAELDRRDFLKLVSVSAGGAAAAGCSDHVEKLIPYVVQPEEITPGKAVNYASTCLECPAACGLHVRTREGRPIKLEGNPEHPVNRGALCALGQASIGRTYHPDRYTKPRLRGAGGSFEEIGWEQATALLAEKLRAGSGRVRALTGGLGPTLGALFDRFLAAVGSAGGRLYYEPFGFEALRQASRAVFGSGVRPIFDLEGADFVIDFGADSLESWLSPVQHARQIEAAREVTSPEGQGARLIYVGPRLSLTAGNADEWLPAMPGSEGILALGIARAAFEAVRGGPAVGGDPALLQGILAGFDPESVASRTAVPAEAIQRIGHAIAQAKRPAALPPGVALTSRRATATAAAVLILDAVVGAIGTTVLMPAEAAAAPEPASLREILELVGAMASGEVSVLLLGGVNPVHSLPPGAGFEGALAKVGFVVSFASLPDETSERAHLILPDHTPLESWGDAAPQPGIRSLVQPCVRPLFDTQGLGDSLLQVGRAMGDPVAAQLPAGSFRSVLEAAWSGTDFRAALARGGVFEAAPRGGALPVSASAARIEFKAPQLEDAGPYIVLPVPSPLLHDGRGANLPWLQETPDPVTKIAWQSWAEISHGTAKALGVERGDVLAVETSFGRALLPALPRGGIRDEVIAIAIGQGHSVGRWASHTAEGRPGEARGVNVITLLPPLTDENGGRAWLTARQGLATGAHARVAQLQFTDNQRQRQLAELRSLRARSRGRRRRRTPGRGGDMARTRSAAL
jgi:anaerobic selenocysteine-containing dehydrogenase